MWIMFYMSYFTNNRLLMCYNNLLSNCACYYVRVKLEIFLNDANHKLPAQ